MSDLGWGWLVGFAMGAAVAGVVGYRLGYLHGVRATARHIASKIMHTKP